MDRQSILVVDDDEDVRNMLCLVLSVEGYTATCAADGVEALQQMRLQEPPALIVLDLMMPRMDGNDLIRTMSADPSLSSIPVAIMSGQISAEAQAPRSQVIARLIKPVELDDLLTVVHQCTDAPRGRRGGDLPLL